MRISSVVWLALVAGIGSVIAIVRVVRAKGNARRVDLGAVSTQWISEHRVGSGNGVGG